MQRAVAFWRPPLGDEFGQWSCPRTSPDCTPGLPSSVMEVFCHCCHLPCTAGVSASARRQRQQCKEVGSERAGTGDSLTSGFILWATFSGGSPIR
uniref:Uncharacterized protein n=1 Tax=Anas zonorhyncha TaxID=75864 RepID=A0A8B9V825_9AVES